MACGKCPGCGTQMEEESVYGARACRCPECGYKTKGGTKKEGGLNYSRTPKAGVKEE